MDYSEKWGKDVDDAVKLALNDLRCTMDQVEVIVLEEPSKGFFGIGSKLAKVRVQRKNGTASVKNVETTQAAPKKQEVAPAPEKREVKPVEAKPEQKPAQRTESSRPENRQRDNNRQDRGARPRNDNRSREQRPQRDYSDTPSITNIRIKPENLQEVTDEPALTFLQEVTTKMGLELSVKAMANEECLYFDISGKDSGSIIGKRGQTLDSIQYLTSLVVNKDNSKYTRVIVDAENYRQKRERTLEQLANRLADKVRRTGKSVRLEPMNPYERKVIHATLQKNSAVTTRSEGEEPYRRVIIEQK